VTLRGSVGAGTAGEVQVSGSISASFRSYNCARLPAVTTISLFPTARLRRATSTEPCRRASSSLKVSTANVGMVNCCTWASNPSERCRLVASRTTSSASGRNGLSDSRTSAMSSSSGLIGSRE